MASMVQRVEDLQQFSCLLSSAEDQLIVVDFYAKWCAPCKAIAPKLALMAEELKAHCVFLKVDVDEAEDVAEKYKVKVGLCLCLSVCVFVWGEKRKGKGERGRQPECEAAIDR